MRYLFYIIIFLTSILVSDDFRKEERIVINLRQNLMWQDDIETIQFAVSWGEAGAYCNELDLNGYNDWRLPSVKELQSIVDIKKYNPSILSIFKYADASGYWSLSYDMLNKNKAWYIGFKTGATFRDSKDYRCYVRCVRRIRGAK